MSLWRFDIAAAPRGRYEVKGRNTSKGKTADYRQFVAKWIWTAWACGTVTQSHYMPDRRQWEMAAPGQQPVAWMEIDEARDTRLNDKGRREWIVPAHPDPNVPSEAERLERRRKMLVGA